jgi:hypothetical protein
LAPTTLPALWRQRVRWAQGWTQASYRHLWKAFGSSALTARQKLGLAWLLGWREIYPWLSPQIYPLILFSLLHPGSGEGFRLNVSLYLLTALFSTMVGPMQALFAYALADPSIRRHRSWFVKFCLVNIFYTEFKNVIARLAPVKELLREHDWHVTPRNSQPPGRPHGHLRHTGHLRRRGYRLSAPPRRLVICHHHRSLNINVNRDLITHLNLIRRFPRLRRLQRLHPIRYIHPIRYVRPIRCLHLIRDLVR